MVNITPELVLRAYAAGVFPMSESRDDQRMFWVDPDERGVIPLDRFHLPRRLKRTVKSGRYAVEIDQRFEAVIKACAAPKHSRGGTWINRDIQDLFIELHRMGHAHSIEVLDDGELAGGLYGLVLGGAFFGESMFSRRRDASKVALVHLVGRLIIGGFSLLDTQFITDHLSQFGAIEIEREDYQARLGDALKRSAYFFRADDDLSAEAVLQSISQTS